MKIVPTNTKTGKDKAIIVAWWLVVLFAIISLFTGGNASSRIGGFLCFAIIAALLSYVAARRIQDQQTGEHTPRNWKVVAPVAAIALIAAMTIGGSGSDTNAKDSSTAATGKSASTEPPTQEVTNDTADAVAPNPAPQETSTKVSAPTTDSDKSSSSVEQKKALAKAKVYTTMAGFSKDKLYEQLTSDYGEKFSPDAAQYAVDHVDVDWNEQALKSGKNYEKTMNMSRDAIYDQLTSDYGENFTPDQAQYAIDHLH